MRVIILAWTLIASAIICGVSAGHRRTVHAAGGVAPEASPSPVLVELFTSEGCSSCPPADALLRKLDETQPVPGARVIALSEHVDYWNGMGWKDPFSARAYSERQERYGDRLRSGGVYTPEMVVDGQFEFVGSDARSASEAIAKAASARKVAVTVSMAPADPSSKISVRVEIGPLPEGSTPTANVWIAVADDMDVSDVLRGENSGRALAHVAVLRELKSAGTVEKTTGYSNLVVTSLPRTGTKRTRIVVMVQESNQGRILGVAQLQYPNP